MPITWTLRDLNEANNVLAVLGKLPYEQVADLIDRLRKQMAEQLAPKQAPVPEPERLKPGVEEF